MFEQLATKQDLQAMAQELVLVLTLRMAGIMAAGCAVTVAVLKLAT